MFQQRFPFIGDITTILTSGVLTPERFMRENISTEEYYLKCLRKDPRALTDELTRISMMLGKRDLEEKGKVTLLSEAAETYYPENFIPSIWIGKVEMVQEDRRIYSLGAVKKDGSTQKIMIKGPKYLNTFLYVLPKHWLTSLSRISLYKNAQLEFETLINLQKHGIKTEKPLGYFEEGLENWLYTEFLEGQNPLELLEFPERREEVLKADARLLARLSKARMKHWYFYSPDFDDKLFIGGEICLIDTDETKDVFSQFHCGKYFKENPEKLLFYYQDWLKDTLSYYLMMGIIKEHELKTYALEFFRERGEMLDLEEILKEVSPDRQTEESYVSMMRDTD